MKPKPKPKLQRKIILASTSPRRQQVLDTTGLKFDVVDSGYEEDMTLAMPPRELAKYLSMGKAHAAARKYIRNHDSQNSVIVIAADTFIAHAGLVLGKPHTPERARAMLATLSGTKISEVDEARIYFKHMTADDIERYIATGEPLERAGGYAAQGLGKEFIEKIEGDFNTVLGLPLHLVMAHLEDLGVTVSTKRLFRH